MDNRRSRMRHGYTTGTCAAAAAKAAAYMLLAGETVSGITLRWSASGGRLMEAEFGIEEVSLNPEAVRCAVRKDAGDDIDVTDGLLIYAQVSRLPEPEKNCVEQALKEAEPAEGVKIIPFPEEETYNEPDFTANIPADEIENHETENLLKNQPVTLSDLEDDNGIIPLRWDKVADFFAPKEASEKVGGRLISFTEEGDFTEAEWSVMQELFQAAVPQEVSEEEYCENSTAWTDRERFIIQGGEGIGIVTKPGLDQPPGEPAINSGPRRMIREAVASVCDTCEYEGGLRIEISVPGGEEIAARTFNPRLGIEGGISILGTTGIVEPMSGRAVAETVRAEIRVKAASSKSLALVPGNTGASFVSCELLVPEEQIVIMSNYPGEAVDEAVDAGTESILITGSLGKMIKLAGGIFYTHSRDADARMDIMIRCALEAGASLGVLKELDNCVTTDAALDVLKERGLFEQTVEVILNRAVNCVRNRAEELQIEMILLRNSGEVIAFTDDAFGVMKGEHSE